jgi:hypothetical protein
MHKLGPVEDAKTLFHQARDWSLWRWLIEKKRARTTADAAWQALDAHEQKVKAAWSEEWQQAYLKPRRPKGLDPEIKAILEAIRQSDEESQKAHEAAEAQFDEADRCLSSSMACEGAQMAIDAWELREKFIRKAEALGRRK